MFSYLKLRLTSNQLDYILQNVTLHYGLNVKREIGKCPLVLFRCNIWREYLVSFTFIIYLGIIKSIIMFTWKYTFWDRPQNIKVCSTLWQPQVDKQNLKNLGWHLSYTDQKSTLKCLCFCHKHFKQTNKSSWWIYPYICWSPKTLFDL